MQEYKLLPDPTRLLMIPACCGMDEWKGTATHGKKNGMKIR
jgi:hypothetical protein